MKKSLKMIAATMVLSLSISGIVSAKTVDFTDVSSHWAKEAINWGVEHGAVNGYEDGTFKPDANINEAEFLSMFLRAFGAEIAKSDTNWSDPVYETAKSLNYPVLGEKDNAIRNQPILRSQVAEIIAGANGESLTGNDAITYLLNQGYTAGKTAPTVEGYAGGDSLSRAEAIQFIKTLNSKGFTELQARPEAGKTEEVKEPTEATAFGKTVIALVNKLVANQPAYKVVEHPTYLEIQKDDKLIASWIWYAFDREWNEIGLSDAGNKESIAFVTKLAQQGGIPVDDKFGEVIAQVNKSGKDQKVEAGQFSINVIAGYVKDQVSIVMYIKQK